MRSGGFFTTIRNDFDAAVTWMHTYTDEASPLESVCLNCHGEKTTGAGYWDDISSTNKTWIQHAYRGRVSRTSMDKAELEAVGHVSGDPAVENPYTTLCLNCHQDRSNRVACSSTRWKDHLIEGRAAQSVWEYVTMDKTGSLCGW